jgi:hypothetical protein
MKKILTLVIAALLTVTIAHAQAGWVSHKADNRISLKFPTEPKEVVAGTFASRGADSVSYIFTMVDFVAVANIDSVTLKPMQDSPEFAAQLKQGIGSSLPNVTLDDFKIGKWKGHTSYTTTGVSATQKSKYYMFMVLIGNNMYSLSTVVPDGVSTKGRDDYFASLILDGK